MERSVRILGALLVLQAILAGLVWSAQSGGTNASGGPLIQGDLSATERLSISGEDGSQVVLEKSDDQWRVKQAESEDSVKADSGRINQLLEQLASLEKSFPVARSEGAGERFAVASNTFRRKLVLGPEDDPLTVLWLGKSPSMDESYVRLDGESTVYRASLAQHQLPTRISPWKAPEKAPSKTP